MLQGCFAFCPGGKLGDRGRKKESNRKAAQVTKDVCMTVCPPKYNAGAMQAQCRSSRRAAPLHRTLDRPSLHTVVL